MDGVGNRTSQTVGSTSTSFTYNNDDELISTSGGIVNSYGYNANGEQTSRTLAGVAYSLSFDYDGQLISITQGSTTTSFTYDAQGRRVSRTAGGTTTNFLYDDDDVLLEQQGGTTTATYTYGNALTRKDSEYPLFDGLGSERTVTNTSQSIQGTINYDSFGNKVGTTGSSTNPYMFAATSQYGTDGDAGLIHVGARYYDAQVGRFITRDSDLEEHPYSYCDHDPVNSVDPDGHQKTKSPHKKRQPRKPGPKKPNPPKIPPPPKGWPDGFTFHLGIVDVSYTGDHFWKMINTDPLLKPILTNPGDVIANPDKYKDILLKVVKEK